MPAGPNHSLVPVEPPAPGMGAGAQAVQAFGTEIPASLLDAFLGDVSGNTRKGYETDLRMAAGWAGDPTPREFVDRLVGSGPLGGHTLVGQYREHLRVSGAAPATINRRMTTLRRVVSLAHALGLIPWTLQVKGVKSKKYRDTRGPGVPAVRTLLAALDVEARTLTGVDAVRAQRDALLIRLIFLLGLRRGEVSGLDLRHVDLRRGILSVLGKGSTQEQDRVPLTLDEESLSPVLGAWVSRRKQEGAGPTDPLFLHLERARGPSGERTRLSGDSIWKVLRARGLESLGEAVRPHGIRHTAITEVLDSGATVREAQRFARHADLRTVTVYDDNRADMAGQASRRLAGALRPGANETK